MTIDTGQKADMKNMSTEKSMDLLFRKLDEAIDDMEQGRICTIDEAWKEIDAITEIELDEADSLAEYSGERHCHETVFKKLRDVIHRK